MTASPARVEAFIAYASSERGLAEKLETHLRPLQQVGEVAFWRPDHSVAGDNLDLEIDRHLEQARLFLLLVSAEFSAAWTPRIARMLERHRAGEARAIPVLAQPCDMTSSQFDGLSPLPRNGRAVSLWKNQDAALTDIAQGIREAVEAMVTAQDKPLERTTFYLTLEGNFDEFDRTRLLNVLQKCSGDFTLKITKAERGSIRLTIDATAAGFDRLKKLHKEGELSKALETEVMSVVRQSSFDIGDIGTYLSIGGATTDVELYEPSVESAFDENSAILSQVFYPYYGKASVRNLAQHLPKHMEPSTTEHDKPRLLLIDDEPQLTRGLHRSLKGNGYEVEVAEDGFTALAIFARWNPDLVITDITMPDMDGIELCRQLRRISSVPIIVLSGSTEERIKVEALDAGADDYIVRPAHLKEWLARIRAGLRRAVRPVPVNPERMVTAHFSVHLDARKVFAQSREVHMSPRELDLLVYFCKNPHVVLSHSRILSDIWGSRLSDHPQYVRVYVGHLRRKLEPDPRNPRYFLSEPSVGYSFEP